MAEPEVTGPIHVVGEEVPSGVHLNIGDKLSIRSEGEVDFGGAVMGFGAPVKTADGEGETTAPHDYPAPNCLKNSLIFRIEPEGTGGVTANAPQQTQGWMQGGTNKPRGYQTIVPGQVILRANDRNTEDNSRGWRVWVEVERAVIPTDPRDVGRGVLGDGGSEGGGGEGEGDRGGLPQIPNILGGQQR